MMLTRRCISYGDLRAAEGAHYVRQDSSSDSDGENPQPIKRSRSDQSLPQLDGTNGPSSGGGSAPYAAFQPYAPQQAQQAACASGTHQPHGASLAARLLSGAAYAPPSSRAQRAPSLPVVLSDMGSSTNSLLSLDSLEAAAAVRSASQQQLNNMLPMQPGTGQPEASARMAGSAAAAAAGDAASVPQLAAGGASPLQVSREHSGSGVVCSLNPASSAASLTAAQLWARGYDMPRATSDASLSSGDYSAALQQLGLPVAYSPPPLLSPGPPGALGADKDTAAAAAAAVDGLDGALGLGSSTAGSFKPGLSIQQQKQASFVGPQQPASSAAAGVWVTPALGSSSWGMRPVASQGSLHSSESITSVEAGERLAGVRFGLPGSRAGHNPSPSQLKQSSTAASSQLPPLSPPNNAGSMQAAALLRKNSSGALGAAGAAGNSSRPQAGAQGSGRPPVPAGGFSSPAPAVAPSWAGSSVVSPGFNSEGSEATSTVPGASPAIELQSMGSVLGGDGQWLFGELSTGAIGALSPTGLVLRQPVDPQDQQQQLGAATAAPPSAAAGVEAGLQQRQQQQQGQQGTAVALAAPVPVSSALPAVSSRLAANCSLPLMPAAGGAFGFGFGAAPAGAAAAAAAAAKLCLFDGAFAKAAGAAQAGQQMQTAHSSSPQPPGVSVASALSPPAGASGISAFSSWGNGSSRGVSAPLPRLSPYRSSLCGVAGADGVMRLGDPRQQQQQPYRPSQHDASQWTFNRRGASLDCARTSLSGRRRGSLDLNMPWRRTLDAAIAKAAADAGMADLGDSPTSLSSGGGGADAATAVDIAASEAEATFGSGALGGAWSRQSATTQLELLMPLPEADDESLPSPRGGCGPGSIGLGSVGSGGRASLDAAELSSHPGSTRSARSSSSGGSVAADHDLPGSTNVGGYIGGSDSLGLARHSLDSPRKAAAAATQQQQQQNSYGLEFDGAVQMETVAAGASPLKAPEQQQQQLKQSTGSALPSLDSDADEQQQQQQQRLAQEQCVKVVVAAAADMSSHEEQESHEEQDSSSDESEEDAMQLSGDSSHQGEQRLAGKRSAPEGWHKAGGPAAAAAGGAGASAFMSAPVSALGLDGPGGAWPSPIDLQSYPSASSISSRGSTGFCSRGGTGNGASRDLELFVRLNRARQTLDFAKRQAQAFSELDRAELGVWEALDLLDGLREYEAGLVQAAAGSGGGSTQDDSQLTPDMSLREHAMQVAELCRLSFPDKPWMALVGLLHGFGKLLAHPLWGSQPQWAVAGESYPVGCKFAPQVGASEFFSANPDRRRRAYSTTLGVYQEGCGLRNVYMSWGAAEYLYMLLVLNQTQLPEEALFMIRYQRCYALTRPGGAYRQLMSPEDKQLLPLLAAFQSILTYRRMPLPAGALQDQAFYDYYSGLINTYLGEEALFW